MEKGCGHIDVLKKFPGDTDCEYIYIYGFVAKLQLFKHKPNDAQTDRQTIHTL